MPQRPEDDDAINARFFLPEKELDADEVDIAVDLDAEIAAAGEDRATFEEALAAIEEGSIELQTLSGLSDLSRSQVEQLADTWRELPADARETIAEHAFVLGEDDLLLDFMRFFRFTLGDEASAVRQYAARGLAAYDDPELIEPLLMAATTDVSDDVRLAAVEALGSFMDMVEFQVLEAVVGERLRGALMAMVDDASLPLSLRAGALESVAVLSRDEASLGAIQRFHDGDDAEMRLGSLRAMGRSANPRWQPILEADIRGIEPDQRQEAIRALGAYDDEALVPLLTLVAREDREMMVRLEAVQSLGIIGGANAVRELRTLREYASEDEIEAIDDAIAEASQDLDLDDEPDDLDDGHASLDDELRRLGL
jgi:hypothetical protein